MQEVKNIEGEVQTIKTNQKSLCINGEWFNNFSLLPEEINKGDLVKIIYTIKQKDDKTFNNIKCITKLNKEVKALVNQEVKTVKTESTNDNIKLISDTARNCIIMQSVIIYLQRKDLNLNEIVKMVRDSYKLI